MRKLRMFFVIGTRPEAIKLAPVIHACVRRKEEIENIVCLTGQHSKLLDQMVRYFGIEAELNLGAMQAGQSLSELMSRLLVGLDQALARCVPDCVVAQGDTTSVLAAAWVAFYRRLPLIHVEAGLRSGNMLQPWPEEMHRRIVSLTAAINCCPSPQAVANLQAEGVIDKTIHLTGNTVIDALFWTLNRECQAESPWPTKYAAWSNRRVVLITGHRRENLGEGIERVCQAIRRLADRLPDVEFVYPVHPNPGVVKSVYHELGKQRNVHLMEPVSYPEFVWLMDRSSLIITDSGGVQEEAPALGRFVLVTRETTERPEVIEAGAAELVGTDTERIVNRALHWLEMAVVKRPAVSPYGDGRAAERIVDLALTGIPR